MFKKLRKLEELIDEYADLVLKELKPKKYCIYSAGAWIPAPIIDYIDLNFQIVGRDQNKEITFKFI